MHLLLYHKNMYIPSHYSMYRKELMLSKVKALNVLETDGKCELFSLAEKFYGVNRV